MSEKKIAGVRLPEEMFKTIEDIYYSCRFTSRSECTRWLLEQGSKDLLNNPNGQLPKIDVSGVTSKDISVQLPEELFEKLEDFRYSRRIPSRAEAIRIVLSLALRNYEQSQILMKK